MKTRNFKTKVYHGCPIYVRYFLNTDDTWEYLTIINNEIYTAQVIIKMKFWQKIFKLYYSRKEEEGTINYMTSMAMTTIETIKNIKPEKNLAPKDLKNFKDK